MNRIAASYSSRTVAGSHCAIRRLRRSLAALLLSLPLLFGLTVPDEAHAQTSLADGSYEVSPNWALKPSGLQAGDKFRLMFVTSTGRNARSPNIAVYNTFVQNRAKAGHTAIRQYSGQFKVVGSTNTVHARDNTGTTGTGVPIYWLNGDKVADNYGDFYDGSWDSLARKNENGSKGPTGRVWTGSKNDGTKHNLYLGRLGHINPNILWSVQYAGPGKTLFTSNSLFANTAPSNANYSLYGLSPVFTVEDDRVQMNNATLRVGESGNHKANGGVRFSVEIGDGAKLASFSRTIKYKVSGSASRGNDADNPKDYYIDGCMSSNCSVGLPANRHSALITIYVTDDGLDEGDETIIITLQDGSGYTVNNARETTTVTITDDDTRGLTFHRRWPAVEEGSSETLTVKLSSQPTEPVEVFIASNNPDVTTTPTSLLFNPSHPILWNTAQTVTVHAAHDNDAVNDEATLTYTTSGGDYGGANALSIDRLVSVFDDETADPITSQLPRISLTGGADVTEGSAASFTVNANPAPTARLTVNVEVIEPPGQDFVAASQEGVRTVTLNAGATSATFTVPTVNDNTDEPDGTVQVFVNDGTGYNTGQGALVTVLDNDGTGPPSVSFAAGSSSAAESAGTRNVTISLSSVAPSGGLTLSYSVSGTATAGSGNDFTIQGSGTLSVAAGANTATIPVAINDDSATENAETVILTLTGGAGYTVGSPSVHTLTIADNDSTSAQPSVSFASASSSAAEDDGTHVVHMDLTRPAPSGGLTIGYNISGTATAGSGNDFTIQNSGTLSVAAGATTATIPVAINDDSSAENAETVILTLTGGTGYTLGSTRVHTLTITDNDGTGQALLSLSGPASANEGNSGTSDQYFTVSLSKAPSRFVSWQLCFTGTATIDVLGGGTISANADYQAISGQTPIDLSGRSPICTDRIFRTSDSSFTNTDLGVRIKGDTESESDETVTVTLSIDDGPADVVLGTSVVTYTIRNDDNTSPPPGTPALQLSSNTLSVSEGGTGSYTVRLATAPTGPVTVNIVSGNPDVTVSSTSLTFNPSGSDLWSTPQTVTVSAAQDPDTINDSATLTHTASGGGYASVTGSVKVTVNDDDAPAVSFASSTSSIAEGDGTNDVTVNLSLVAPVGGLTLGYRVTGTATAGSDFTTLSGTLSVAAGARTATIPVVINDDSTPETAETVILTLTGGPGYKLGSPSTHTLTITNDDGHEISFASAEGQAREGEDYTVAVHVFPAADQDKDIEYSIAGTATQGEDFEDLPVMVAVSAGESQGIIRIETIADKEDDSGETVILTLQSDMSQELSLGTPSVHTLTIEDSKEAIVEAGRSWLVRFGRSVAEQVVDSISQRLRATRTEGTQVNVAGAQVPIGQSRAFGTFEPPTTNRPVDDFDTHSQISAPGSTQTLSEREVLQSSSFMSVSESDAQGGSFAVWGRAAHSSFEGREDALSLDGDSTSVMLGADYAQQTWQAGATLIQSEGKGDYSDEVISGDAEASITSIVPWAAVQATERVQLWGAFGTGDGDLELTEEDSDTMKTNIDWSMAAAGLRSVLVPASSENGLQLSLVSDALWVETKADPIEGLSIADADASRLRLGLEGEYATELSSGAAMISRLEFGVREDSGDAETGGGIEIGGGVAWSDASQGLRIELAGRKLLSYDNDELEDEGISLSFDYDPVPGSAEGLSLSLNQEIGVRSNGGLEALFDSESLATRTDGEKENRVRLEAAYGVPVLGGRFIGSPHMGLGLATGSREYTLGWKVTPERHAPDLSFGVRATRTENDVFVPDHAIRFETIFRW